MRFKTLFLGVISALAFTTIQAQDISLEDIWNKGTFRISYMRNLNPIGENRYTLLNYGTKGAQIDVYRYKTLQKEETILYGEDIGVPKIDGYHFSQDLNKVLLYSDSEQIFRHSFRANYYVYDSKTKKCTKVSDAKIQEPSFNSQATKVAYAYQNNLYIKDLNTGATKRITQDGEKNKIINGITDWVYEEEFAFVRAFAWNKMGDKIAFLRFDESKVPMFYMNMMGKALYPENMVFKYPKAGENNSEVTLHIYDVKTQKTQKIALGTYYYIPRIKWTANANTLSVQVMNRHQNDLKFYFLAAATGDKKLILHEKDDAYIDIDDDLTFLSDNRFLWTSEKDGYKHLYLYNSQGKLIRQLTKGAWEVTQYYGYQPKKKLFYYQSTQPGSIYRAIYQVGINGKKPKRIGPAHGTNSGTFSGDKNYLILQHNDHNTPLNYTLYYKGKKKREIQNNDALAQKVAKFKVPKKVYATVKINGANLNMWMMKPDDFDENKTYPLLMYQYSGPGSQNVADKWYGSNDYWYAMLAKKGYIIACVDGRGTGFKGAKFKKMTYQQLGKYEVQDQIDAARYFGKLPYIDANRIGIWGWSYGGFMASNCIFQGNDVFKLAIAVAPVTSWRYYDSVYTERYMRTPQENADGYDDNSPITHAHKLKGKFLLVHGTGDDNVHLQNAYQLTNALVKANKQFDLAIYPDRAHGIWRGKNTRLHLYQKMTDFILNNL